MATHTSNREIRVNLRELVILLNHLSKQKDYSVIEVKYHPKPKALFELDLGNLNVIDKVSSKTWKQWEKEVNKGSGKVFPYYSDYKNLKLKVRTSVFEGLDTLMSYFSSDGRAPMLTVDTNTFYYQLFTNHILPKIKQLKLNYPLIVVPEPVLRELNENYNEENRNLNSHLKKAHGIKIPQGFRKFTLKKRQAIIAINEYNAIRPYRYLQQIKQPFYTMKLKGDLSILDVVVNFQREGLPEILVLSKDKSVNLMVKNYNLDTIEIELSEPKSWDLRSLAQYLYLLTMDLVSIDLDGIGNLNVNSIGADNSVWESQEMSLSFHSDFPKDLQKKIEEDINLYRFISSHLHLNPLQELY